MKTLVSTCLLASFLASPAFAVPLTPGTRSLRLSAEAPTLRKTGERAGGMIKLDAVLDSQQPYSDFPRFAQPARLMQAGVFDVWPDAVHQSANLSVRESQLFLEFARPRSGPWWVDGYVELSLLGYPSFGQDAGGVSPALRYAYARLTNTNGLSLYLGQLGGPFAPLDAPVLNASMLSYSGNVGIRLPQLRAEWALGAVRMTVAAMRPADPSADQREIGPDMVGHGQDSGMPEFEGRLAWEPDFLGKVPYGDRKISAGLGFSGRFGQTGFDLGTSKPARLNSFGAALDLVTPQLGPLSMLGEVYYGRDMSKVFGLGGVTGMNDVTGHWTPTGALNETGGWLGLQLAILPGVTTHLVYGTTRPDVTAIAHPGITQDTGFDVTCNETVAWNVVWAWLPGTTLGFEVARLNTGYLLPSQGGSKLSGKLDRLQLSMSQAF